MVRKIRYIILLSVLFLAVDGHAQVTNWQDIYEVKAKDTLFGIARKYSISLAELKDANPKMREEGYQLKQGETIFVPFGKHQNNPNLVTKTVVKQSPVAKNKVKAENKNALRIGFMLPLHDVDGDGRRMIEYYRGFLLACQDLKAKGVSVDVHAWNVPIDANIRETLNKEDAKKCQVIFGPLYSRQVKQLADFCKINKINLVIPFSIDQNEMLTNPRVFQVYQNVENQTQDAIDGYLKLFTNYHPIFVDCNDAQSDKGLFTMGLRKQLEKHKIPYNLTNIASSDADFAKSFSSQQPNMVIVNTGKSPELNATFAKLDILKASQPGLRISLFGYTDWLMYTKVYTEYFSKYDAHIPTYFYYNASSNETKLLEARYREAFHASMQAALPRFALTGYDHGVFFISGFHEFGDDFAGTSNQTLYKALQTPLRFHRIGKGGYQNETFMLIHYKTDGSIESISF